MRIAVFVKNLNIKSKTNHYTLATIGVVHVGRCLQQQPLSITEEQYTNAEQMREQRLGQVVAMQGALSGTRHSSTRAELLAAILAMLAPKALHFAKK